MLDLGISDFKAKNKPYANSLGIYNLQFSIFNRQSKFGNRKSLSFSVSNYIYIRLTVSNQIEIVYSTHTWTI